MKLLCSTFLSLAVLAVTPCANAGNLYTMTNAEAGNEVLWYTRNEDDGTLTFAGAFDTGGIGANATVAADDPLGSQGAMTLSDDGQCLFVVNAGSDTVTSFSLAGDSPENVGVYDTDGAFPASVTVHDRLLYVLNAGNDDDNDGGSITGFRVNENLCQLTPVPFSTMDLNAAQRGEGNPFFLISPGQISFTPDGENLIVTIKGTSEGRIWVFPVLPNGRTGSGVLTVSEGFTPFGFDFDNDGNVIVSEAFGTADDAPAADGKDIDPIGMAGAVSSYVLNKSTLDLEVISSSIGNGQTAPCWLKRSGDCAVTTNNIQNTISTYSINEDGEVTLVAGAAEFNEDDLNTINAPIDHVFEGRYMYVLSTGHTLEEEETEFGQVDDQPALYVFSLCDATCELTLVEVVLDGLPNEEATLHGVVGLVAN